MQKIKFGPFESTVTLRDFTISRGEGSVTFAPSEAEKIVKLILHALSLNTWRVLPERISDSPIRIRFTAERDLYLDRTDNKNGEVLFRFEEGDDLIAAIKNSIAKVKDITNMQSGKKKTFSSSNIPDPVIIGSR